MKRTATIDDQSLNSRAITYGIWAYPALLLIMAAVSHFAILSNDSFPLQWQAEHLSLHDPASFFNGFFPIGYPLLLRITDLFGNPYTLLEIFQILLAGLYLKKVWAFIQPLFGSTISPIATVFIVFSPQLIRAELSAVPDFFAALFVLFAIVKIVEGGRHLDRIAGVYLGLGLLFRAHVLAFIVGISIALIIVEWRAGLRRTADICVAAIPFLIVQGLIQVWSGHDFFENLQAFNVWKAMHGVDWANPPSHFSATIFQVITAEPSLFLHTYVSLLASAFYLIIPLFIFLVIAVWKGERRDPLVPLSLAALFYLLIIVIGGSPRSVLLVMPIVITSVFAIIRFVLQNDLLTESRNRIAIILSVVLALIASVAMLFGAIHAAQRVATYNDLQQALHISLPEQVNAVYSDDFALYFPALADATPRTSGGWAELGLPEYLHEYPHISDSTSEIFYAALQQNRIGFAVFRNPAVDARMLNYAKNDTGHFIRVPFTGPFTIYKLQQEDSISSKLGRVAMYP